MKYKYLESKYNVPKYEDIKKEINIDSIEEDKDLVREILNKLDSKTSKYANLIEDLIQSDSSFTSMHESGYVRSKNVNLNEILMKLMKMNRDVILTLFNYEEEKAVESINKLFSEWIMLKPEVNKVLELLRDSWKEKINEKKDWGYFG